VEEAGVPGENHRPWARITFLGKKMVAYTNRFTVFYFSENYIFGKFDTFCRRLERIADMINTMEMFSGLGDIKIEGVDIIANKYKTIVDSTGTITRVAVLNQLMGF
jgi:dynein heavy chain